MADDLKPYRAILSYGIKKQTATSLLSKLSDIIVDTEDTVFRELLATTIKGLQDFIRERLNHGRMQVDLSNNNHKALVDYCVKMVKSAVPAWQVIARRHGWTPPH